MKTLGVTIGTLCVLAAATFAMWGGDEPRSTETPAAAERVSSPLLSGDVPTLKGAMADIDADGTSPDDMPTEAAGPPAQICALVEKTKTGTEAEQYEALKAIQALDKKGDIDFAWIVDWALIEVPDGKSNALLGWAFAKIRANSDAALEYLPQILEAAVGASSAKQQAIARLLPQLRRGRSVLTAEHVPLVLRVFQAEGTEYWLKRVLVTHLSDLKDDATPLGEALIDFAGEVLADREVAAREAAAANRMVSWDHAEFDVQTLLGSMGDSIVPTLRARVHEVRARRRRGEARSSRDALGVLTGALGAAGEDGVQALIAMLQDPAEDIRTAALWGLREVEGPHEGVRGALLTLLQDDDGAVRARAAELLGDHGAASISELLKLLSDKDARVRKAAAASLADLGVEPKDALAPMLALLAGDDESAAGAAAASIASFGAEGAPALPVLIRLLPERRSYALVQFREAIVTLAAHDLDAVLDGWADANADLRVALIQILSTLIEPRPKQGPRSTDPRIASAIRAALQDGDVRVRVFAANHLARTKTPRVIEVLREGFTAKDGRTRITATKGLGTVGAAVLDMLPAMIERAEGEDLWLGPGAEVGGGEDEGYQLGQSMAALGAHDLPRMFALLASEKWYLSYGAKLAFEARGVEGLRWLEAHFEGASTKQKLQALDIVRGAHFKQGDSAKALRTAARALGQRGLGDTAPRIRLKAVKSLAQDRGMADVVMPILLKVFTEKDEDLLDEAAHLIYALGERAKPFRTQIEALLKHPSERVVNMIRQVLTRFEG